MFASWKILVRRPSGNVLADIRQLEYGVVEDAGVYNLTTTSQVVSCSCLNGPIQKLYCSGSALCSIS